MDGLSPAWLSRNVWLGRLRALLDFGRSLPWIKPVPFCAGAAFGTLSLLSAAQRHSLRCCVRKFPRQCLPYRGLWQTTRSMLAYPDVRHRGLFRGCFSEPAA